MLNFLIAYIVIQSLLFAVILASTRMKHNFWLASLFLVYSLRYGLGLAINIYPDLLNHIYLVFITESIDTFFPGIIAVYCSMLIYNRAKPQQALLLIAPFMFLLFVIGLQTKAYESSIDFYRSSLYSNAGVGFHFIFLIFLIYQIRVLNKARNSNEELRHDRLISLSWIRYFLLFQIINSTFALLYYLPSDILLTQYLYSIRVIIGTGSLIFTGLFILIMGYIAIRKPILINQGEVTNFRLAESRIIESVLPENKKQKRGIVNDEDLLQFVETITNTLYQQKRFLDNELNLNKASEYCNIPPHKLSYTINQNWKLNFNELINSWRVEHAIYLLESNNQDELKLYAIAIDSGFNSETTFYKHFKKITGKTPSEYRELGQS